MSMSEKAWLSTQDAADYLAITTRTLYRLIDRGEIPAYQIGRVFRLRRAEVDAFIDRARIRPGTLAHLHPGQQAPTETDGDAPDPPQSDQDEDDADGHDGDRPGTDAGDD